LHDPGRKDSLEAGGQAALIESVVDSHLILPEVLFKVLVGLTMHAVRKVKLVSSNVVGQPVPGNPGN
ncbi:hypothetical protein XENOCAPTIV_011352, partial [Xenoophorus captivus]